MLPLETLLGTVARTVAYSCLQGRGRYPPVGGAGWLLVSLAVRDAARRDAPMKAGDGVRYCRGGRRALPTAPLKAVALLGFVSSEEGILLVGGKHPRLGAILWMRGIFGRNLHGAMGTLAAPFHPLGTGAAPAPWFFGVPSGYFRTPSVR